ncbi:MAG: PorP/SprF family type IX secretion system membrane protein [Saprospiraceae bacterium]|nr:PorP/SprF family type IX secretion system membrane protein [Saprospiraceae bacterium]
MKRSTLVAIKAALLFLLLPFAQSVRGQDIHFSQFYNSPLSLSPALTGVHSGDYRFIGNYRSQWQSALVPYTTFFGTADVKFFNPRKPNGYFSGGLIFSYDAAGDAKLSTTHVGLSGSYTLAIDTENFLTLGIYGGVIQRAFQPGELTFDHQFSDIFDPNRPTNEDFQSTSRVFADFGAGLNYHGQSTSKRSKLDVGGGVYHLTNPDGSFSDADNAEIPMRVSLYMMPVIQIATPLDWVLHGSAQLQGSYFEALAGTGLLIHLSNHRAREVAVQVGANYRFNSFGDAIIPTVELHLYNQWKVGVSYDINVSDFSVATNNYGGPEVSVQYLITKVRPLDKFKICKLF